MSELRNQLKEVVYLPHSDSEHVTCASLYYDSPDGKKSVYAYNATPHHRETWTRRDCDCGVEREYQDLAVYIQKREAEAYKKGYLEGTMVGVVNISKDREKAKRLAKKIMKDHSRSEA